MMGVEVASWISGVARRVIAGWAVLACALASHAQSPKKPVEVLSFQGGYGVDFFQKAAEEFNQLRPEYQVSVTGSPQAWSILIPRLAAGTPPDLTWPGWGMNLRPTVLEGQILSWEKYLQQPAFGGGKKWVETFNPAILRIGVMEGQPFVLPFNIDTYGWWYDKTLFDKHGWTPPATFEEFLVLGEEMKKVGVAPLTFQGRYPYYVFNGIFYPWAISAGGLDAYKAVTNLEPGAWKHPAYLKVARTIMELKKRKFFQGGCIGMNHTESQMELLVGRAAMIPCGTWLYAEMKNLLAPTTQLTFAKIPVFADGVGDPSIAFVSPDGKGWCLPTRGSNPDGAAEFYRYLTSPEKAAQFTEQKGTLTAITPEREINMPPYLQGPAQVIKDARATWANNIFDWYTELETELETAFVDMYNELITPEQFIDRVEKASQAYRAKIGRNRIQWD